MMHILVLMFVHVVQADVIPSGLPDNISKEQVKVGDIKDIEELGEIQGSMHEQVVDTTPKASRTKTRKVGVAIQILGFDILPYFLLNLFPYGFAILFNLDIFNNEIERSPITENNVIAILSGITVIMLFCHMPLTITLHTILLPIVDYARYRYYFTDNYHSFAKYLDGHQGIYNQHNMRILVCSATFLLVDFLILLRWRIPKMRRFLKAEYSRELDYQPTNCAPIDTIAKILLGSDVYTRPKQQTIEDDQDTDDIDDIDTNTGTLTIEEVIDTDSTID